MDYFLIKAQRYLDEFLKTDQLFSRLKDVIYFSLLDFSNLFDNGEKRLFSLTDT